MRNTFIEELVSFARKDPHIALVVGDLGYSVVEPFADEFPDRFINAGVAEQNMASLSAGMASEGYHVFTYSIANFPTFRCAEQIRNDIAYHDYPVTTVSVGGGLAYGALGYSHHAVQDYALMRSFPNMLIAAPGDPNEVRAVMRYLIDNPGPSYLRLGKVGEATHHDNIPQLSPGQWVQIRKGKSNKAILTTGATLQIGIDYLANKKYENFSLYSLPIWSMNSKVSQIDIIKKFDEVVTIEDHLLDGGFGSWLLESCISASDVIGKIRPIALDPVVCGTVGVQKILNQIGGIALGKS